MIQYNKGAGGALIPFYVARDLPAPVGRILYEYLVYIRPFVRHLQAEHDLLAPEQPHYLWPAYRRPDADPTLDMDRPDDEEEEDEDGHGSGEEEEEADKEQREAISSDKRQGF